VDADDRQRPILEHRQDPIADSVEVLHQVPLRRPGTIEERLVKIRQGDAVALFPFALRTHGVHDAITGWFDEGRRAAARWSSRRMYCRTGNEEGF
jgi:hypothetical protein